MPPFVPMMGTDLPFDHARPDVGLAVRFRLLGKVTVLWRQEVRKLHENAFGTHKSRRQGFKHLLDWSASRNAGFDDAVPTWRTEVSDLGSDCERALVGTAHLPLERNGALVRVHAVARSKSV